VGKASSSKKVQRAARAAEASRGGGESRERGFPLLVGVLVLLGVGLVLAARGTREPAVAPTTGTHWHNAIEFYDCGTLQPALLGQVESSGIHTHADNLMHIEPGNSAESGTNARLKLWLDAAGAVVNESIISAPDFGTIDASLGCGGSDSVIKVARWDVDGPTGVETPLEVFTTNLDQVRLLQNRQAFTVAKVAVDEDPPPPSAAAIAQLNTNTGFPNPPPDSLPADAGLQDDGLDNAPGDDTSGSGDAPADEPAEPGAG